MNRSYTDAHAEAVTRARRQGELKAGWVAERVARHGETERFLDEVADLVENIEYDACKQAQISIHDLTALERHDVRAAAWAGLGLPL